MYLISSVALPAGDIRGAVAQEQKAEAATSRPPKRANSRFPPKKCKCQYHLHRSSLISTVIISLGITISRHLRRHMPAKYCKESVQSTARVQIQLLQLSWMVTADFSWLGPTTLSPRPQTLSSLMLLLGWQSVTLSTVWDTTLLLQESDG